MFSAGSGQAVPAMRVNFSTAAPLVLPRHQGPDISQMSADRGGCDHRRRHDVRPRADALTPAKIPVGGRGAALAFGDLIAVDSDTHRTAGVGPFQSGVAELPVE